jgi:hydroxymethylpyrimidine pyrophosphatase-like HAD family hydrolase
MTNETIYYVTSDGTAIIVNKNANKEYALVKLAEWFNIPLTDVIAFGDDVNDLNMIKTAGTGVAMGNAAEQVKEIADYITGTNNNDGIALWINKYL